METTQNQDIPLEKQGYAGRQDIEEFPLDTIPSAPPYIMTAIEQNFMDKFKATVNSLVIEGDNMEIDEVSQSNETYSANPQDTHLFTLPIIHLFRTNSEGHRAQFDILSEDFLPKSSRLPYPFM